MSDDTSRQPQAGQHQQPSPNQPGQQPRPDQQGDKHQDQHDPTKEGQKPGHGHEQDEKNKDKPE